MNLLSTFDRFNQAYPAKGALASFRQGAYTYATHKGLPNRKDEDWHYTSVKVLSDIQFMPSAFNISQPSIETQAFIKSKLPSGFTNLVFINGELDSTLSDEFPAGFHLREGQFPLDHFDDTFDAINGAYLVKPYVFALSAETSVEKPVNFLFITNLEGGPALMVHPRIQVEVGERSSAKILESYYGASQISYFVNSVMDLHVGAHAKVIYVRLQAESESAINIGRSRIKLEKNATLESLAFATGAGLSRHSLDVLLNGQGSHSEILGAYAVTGSQHVDNTTVINHVVGDCVSNQLYKGILDQESRAVFCGKVVIQKGAQKANSAQLNNNLLLSSKAEADSKPNLEIFADDVKASHGSTVGQLNQDEVFYLQSRAISREKAVAILSKGYLLEVIYKISDVQIQEWLSQHLEEAFTRIRSGQK